MFHKANASSFELFPQQQCIDLWIAVDMLHAEKKWKIAKLFLQLHTTDAYAGEVHWVHMQPSPPPPPTPGKNVSLRNV